MEPTSVHQAVPSLRSRSARPTVRLTTTTKGWASISRNRVRLVIRTSVQAGDDDDDDGAKVYTQVLRLGFKLSGESSRVDPRIRRLE